MSRDLPRHRQFKMFKIPPGETVKIRFLDTGLTPPPDFGKYHFFLDKIVTAVVCADCGNEQATALPEVCEKCGSPRTITVKFAEEHFGPNWRQECFPSIQPQEAPNGTKK